MAAFKHRRQGGVVAIMHIRAKAATRIIELKQTYGNGLLIRVFLEMKLKAY